METVILLFSEGIFTLGPAPEFLRVWHPGFVDLGPTPAFSVMHFLHQRDILLSLVRFHSDMRYKDYRIGKNGLFL